MLAPLAALALLAEGVTMDWRAPPECPGQEVVLAGLAGLVDETAAAPLDVTATTRRIGDRYELVLRIRTSAGSLRRRLVSEDCATLAEAAELLVAIVLDPLEVAEVVTPAASPTSRAPADDVPSAAPVPAASTFASPPPSAPTPRRPPAPRPEGVQPLVRVDLGLDAGATQGVGYNVGGALGLLRRRLRVELLGLYLLPRPLVLGEAQVGRVARWSLGARACGRVRQGRIELPLCVGVEGGQYLAVGAGITVMARDARPPWFALLAGLGLIWSPHRRVGLGGRADLLVAPFRAQFSVGGELVHSAQPLGVRVALGVEVRVGP